VGLGMGFGVLLVVDVGEGNAGAYNIISIKRQEHGDWPLFPLARDSLSI